MRQSATNRAQTWRMHFCEANGIDYVFGVAGNAVLDRAVDIAADDIRTRRALDQAPVVRG